MHKIFDRHLDIDLKELMSYLDSKYDEMLTNSLKEDNQLNDFLIKKYTKNNNMPMKVNKKYNIFKFENHMINTLYKELKSCFLEVCEFYNIDFEKENYMIRGWFNYDQKSQNGFSVDPRNNPRYFHDHLGGHGVPDFHGYYSVNAEPSVTLYKIDDAEIYENVNKNNRLIICSNGFPHGRSDWFETLPRITIAYDIVPYSRLIEDDAINNPNWIKFL